MYLQFECHNYKLFKINVKLHLNEYAPFPTKKARFSFPLLELQL